MSSPTTRIKILHVDDEDDTLAVVKTILEHEGYEVISVKRGDEALKMIKMDGFDLLILDIMMPDMSGWELFSRISTINPQHKVIFLSILEISEENLAELKSSGVRDYITKPFDRQDFLDRVNLALKTQ